MRQGRAVQRKGKGKKTPQNRRNPISRPQENSAFMYDIYKHRILQVLLSAYRSLTTRQIAEFSGMSYSTARLHLKELSSMGKVSSTPKGNRIYWEPQEHET